MAKKKERVAQLPGQTMMEVLTEEAKESTISSFKLTEAEKAFIRAYYKYRSVICAKPTIGDILFVFKWDDETHERYVAAWRDFSLDDQECRGAFDAVRKAIGGYLEELDRKNGWLFELKF